MRSSAVCPRRSLRSRFTARRARYYSRRAYGAANSRELGGTSSTESSAAAAAPGPVLFPPGLRGCQLPGTGRHQLDRVTTTSHPRLDQGACAGYTQPLARGYDPTHSGANAEVSQRPRGSKEAPRTKCTRLPCSVDVVVVPVVVALADPVHVVVARLPAPLATPYRPSLLALRGLSSRVSTIPATHCKSQTL